MAKNFGFIGGAGLLFERKFDKAVATILNKNLAVKADESLLIIFDNRQEKLAKDFLRSAIKILPKVDMLKMPPLKINGAEPKPAVAKKMLQYDALVLLTSKSLSHTKARRNASYNGVRIASMPGCTKEIIRRSIDIDYTKLKKRTLLLIRLLNRSKLVSIATKYGTVLTFSVAGRKAHGSSAGIYDKKGKWGNLPEGEVFIAPMEGTATGIFVVDGSIAGFGKVNHPLIFIVERGFVKKVTDGKKPIKIERLLNKFGKSARNIAEFGIGLNPKALVTGIVLEDEKAYSTCHIALGNNIGFGGMTDVPLHIDCVIKKPTIFFDSKLIMKSGKMRI